MTNVPWKPQYDETIRRKRQEVVERAAAAFRERGFTGLTMSDLASATGRSRAMLYQDFGDAVDLLIATCEALLIDASREGLADPTPWCLRPVDIASRIASRHESDMELELVLRGVAAGGVPRARGLVARLELERLNELRQLQGYLRDHTGEKVQLLQRLLDPGSYAHLVVRCGWSRQEYVDWIRSELEFIRRWRPKV